MKKVIKKEVHFCDACGRETDYPRVCIGCGVEYCYDCSVKLSKVYPHGVGFSGSGDGQFCKKCDANPPEPVRALYDAYKVIQCLRREREGFYQEFEERSEKAEAVVKQLYRECEYADR